MEKLRPGLTTVYSGQNPVVDIVAVHSPNRNSIQSFTSTATGKFWLGDEDMLPRDIPNCRVLVYNHGGSGSIMGAATELVESLVHNRRSESSTERPIMFICHSVGGIIAKQAIIHSKSCENKTLEAAYSIYVSTYSLLFVGMPDSQLLNSGILRDVEDAFEPMMERFRTSSLWEISIPVKDCDMEDFVPVRNSRIG
ncbi:hypothetical protein SI65_05955 [Aspergillus cristatus]|uniref:DUF676 domain-containing protein n=1 Tax=Aspergillus cristatus TaxID=573508 RepID=A0A1E3BEI7_ASPCR|nr:hypothetical protein SI65_05955 [Aspergillus cristatus]